MLQRNQTHDVVVLGAGVSGLSSAYFLARSGLKVCLIENYDHCGGNHLSREINGFSFDVGSIFFGSNDPQFKMFPGCDIDFVPVDLTFDRITAERRISGYPLSFESELFARPDVLVQTVTSLIWARSMTSPGSDAESYAKYYLGNYFYEHSGLGNYLRRFYGSDPRNINLEFVQDRMNLHDLTSIRSLSKRLISRARRRTLGPQINKAIARPREGFKMHYDKIEHSLRDVGVDIICEAGMEYIRRDGGVFEVGTKCGVQRATRVINTLPLAILLGLLGEKNIIELESSILITMFCSFAGRRGFSGVVLYNFDNEGAWKRLTMHSDYYGKVRNREFFSLEVTSVRKQLNARELFADFGMHMKKIGLFDGDLRLEGHMQLNYAYPVCNIGSEERRRTIISYLSSRGIESIGRQGFFKYIPHSSIAIEAVQNRYGQNEKWAPFSGPTL